MALKSPSRTRRPSHLKEWRVTNGNQMGGGGGVGGGMGGVGGGRGGRGGMGG